MSKSAAGTREKILDVAHRLILSQGFAATSLDQILGQAGVTKGAFFHHFKSKDEMAHALIERYAQADERLLEDTMTRAERLSRDPLQQVLIVIGLFEEMFDALEAPHPGCLLASYCYQNDLMTDEVRRIASAALMNWRNAILAKLREAVRLHRPRLEVDLDSLADLLNVALEGAFVLSKTLNEPRIVVRQLRHVRNYLELLFDVAPRAAALKESAGARAGRS